MTEKPKARLTIEQHQQAIKFAIWIDASPHEWPTLEKVPLLCNALLDSVVMVDYFMKRLAAVEAERDAALKRAAEARETADNYAGHCNEACKQLEAVEAERDAARKLYDERQDDWIAERASLQALNMQLVKNHDAMQAERDAARVGEARAVEALDVFARAYRVSMLPFAPGIDEADGAYHWMPHGWPSVADFKLANSVLSDSPALAWLSQQRREAAAEALDRLAVEWWAFNDEYIASELSARAAALRAGEVGE